MRLIIHQLSALQAAAILAASARQARQWYLVEGDALGAVNADRTAWVYEHAAAAMVPALMDRPEPQLEDYEPEIEPQRVAVLESTPRLVLVEEPTEPAMRLLRGGWFREEDSQSA
jgi:hypothetical protein